MYTESIFYLIVHVYLFLMYRGLDMNYWLIIIYYWTIWTVEAVYKPCRLDTLIGEVLQNERKCLPNEVTGVASISWLGTELYSVSPKQNHCKCWTFKATLQHRLTVKSIYRFFSNFWFGWNWWHDYCLKSLPKTTLWLNIHRTLLAQINNMPGTLTQERCTNQCVVPII